MWKRIRAWVWRESCQFPDDLSRLDVLDLQRHRDPEADEGYELQRRIIAERVPLNIPEDDEKPPAPPE